MQHLGIYMVNLGSGCLSHVVWIMPYRLLVIFFLTEHLACMLASLDNDHVTSISSTMSHVLHRGSTPTLV